MITDVALNLFIIIIIYADLYSAIDALMRFTLKTKVTMLNVLNIVEIEVNQIL